MIRQAIPALLAGCGLLLAAGNRAELVGLIQDSSGGALVSATVTAMDEESGIRRTTQTDGQGAYRIAALPQGEYRVTVRRPGFQTVVRWNVNIQSGEDARLDFVMRVGSVREVLTIRGGPSPINADDGAVGTLVGREAVGTLPISGRGVMSLIELSPGVVATPAANGEAGQFSTNGLRSNANYFTVDGVSANTGVTGGGLPAQFAGTALPAMTAFGSTGNLASLDALDNVRILTSSFAPEFGRLPGAQVALTTRSGSDQFHGSAAYSIRNEALDANDWFANAEAQHRTPLRLNQWSATLGGPLRRGRTFFFASYEGLRLEQPYTWILQTPSLTARGAAPPALQPVLNAFPAPGSVALSNSLAQRVAEFSRPSRLDALGLRIDRQLTDRISLFGRYNRAPSSTDSGFAQIEHFQLQTSSVTLGAITQFTPAVSNDLRTNVWSTTADSQWSANRSAGGTPLDFAALFPPAPGTFPAFYGVAIGGVGALYAGASGQNHQGQWNLADTLAIHRGNHLLRLGIDYQRLTPSRNGAAESVVVTWNSLPSLLSGAIPSITTSQADQASALIETLSTFAQDTWVISPRLTVTYGLRWEVTPAPAIREPVAAAQSAPPPAPPFATPTTSTTLQPSTQALWGTHYTQFAPRAGAAFRVSDTSIIRAGWGIFYDLGFSTALDPINGFPFNRWQFTSAGATAPTTSAPAFGPRVAPGLELPYTSEWNVAYERMFGLHNILSASYVGSSGHRLLRYEGPLEPGTHMAQFVVATNHGESHYDGLQFQYRRRLTQGLQGTASYAWAHSIDNGSWDSGVYLAGTGQALPTDRASSSFDVRHNFTAGLSYSLGRWQGSAMLRARTGFPIDVQTTENFLGFGFDDVTRPDLVPGVPLWMPGHAIGGRLLNPAAFSIPAGIQGSLGRNAIAGAGMSQIDLAVERTVSLTERVNLELRFEAHNALNHPNPADPVRFLDNPLFGAPVSMLNLMLGSGTARSGLTPAFQIGGSRSVQLSVRLRF